MNRTLLAFHAHPDDESSKAAGTVATYADAGVRCVLLVATGGEAGDILNPAMDHPHIRERLPEVRRSELDAAAAIIGYKAIIELGFRDSGMPGTDANRHPDAFVNAGQERALFAVVEAIRTERPQVLLGYDEHRYYPHPDHLRVHELGLIAFRAAADPRVFPDAGEPWQVERLYAPVFTRARILMLHQAALERGLESPFEQWLERFPEDHADTVDARVPIATTLGRARQALKAHATQVDPDGFWFRLPEDLILEVYPYEDFRLLAGAAPIQGHPVEDLFAGL